MSSVVVTAYVRPQREYQAISVIKEFPGVLGWMKFEGTGYDHTDRVLRFEAVLGPEADAEKFIELFARAATSKTIADVLIFKAPVEAEKRAFTF